MRRVVCPRVPTRRKMCRLQPTGDICNSQVKSLDRSCLFQRRHLDLSHHVAHHVESERLEKALTDEECRKWFNVSLQPALELVNYKP